MRYQEKFELTEYSSPYFSKQFDILITGFREDDDERHTFIKKSLKDYKGLIYSLDTCENADEFYYKIEDHSGNVIESSEDKSLIPDLENLLKKKEFESSRFLLEKYFPEHHLQHSFDNTHKRTCLIVICLNNHYLNLLIFALLMLHVDSTVNYRNPILQFFQL